MVLVMRVGDMGGNQMMKDGEAAVIWGVGVYGIPSEHNGLLEL